MPETNNQIQREIAAIKTEYTKNQRLRNDPTLTILQRQKLTLAQSQRVKRVAALENLLSQRFKFN